MTPEQVRLTSTLYFFSSRGTCCAISRTGGRDELTQYHLEIGQYIPHLVDKYAVPHIGHYLGAQNTVRASFRRFVKMLEWEKKRNREAAERADRREQVGPDRNYVGETPSFRQHHHRLLAAVRVSRCPTAWECTDGLAC